MDEWVHVMVKVPIYPNFPGHDSCLHHRDEELLENQGDDKSDEHHQDGAAVVPLASVRRSEVEIQAGIVDERPHKLHEEEVS